VIGVTVIGKLSTQSPGFLTIPIKSSGLSALLILVAIEATGCGTKNGLVK